uniref:Helix-turn-helix DNA binding domain protein n=1 Tax=Microbacterium phage Judebell TaxID=3230835 RepID=A0AAU8EFV7_9CAUD
MSETVSTPIPEALIDAISAAWRDRDATLATRARVIRRAIDAGFTVKSITAQMSDAARINPEITAVSSTVYGFAAAAAGVLIELDMPSSSATSEQLATLVRAAAHVKVSAFKAGVKSTLAPLGDDVSAADKLEAVCGMAAIALTTVRADRVKAPREPRPNMGSGDTDAADVPNDEDRHPATGKPDAAETLAALRRATKYLTQGGTVDPIMASAISDFTKAAAMASRRTHVAA